MKQEEFRLMKKYLEENTPEEESLTDCKVLLSNKEKYWSKEEITRDALHLNSVSSGGILMLCNIKDIMSILPGKNKIFGFLASTGDYAPRIYIPDGHGYFYKSLTIVSDL
ncbi:hypothetical protein FNH22_26810 [Fulvivirga sp. M361]|uniref:hypothetical protein n=1 Tax=Fulvivirga sp. M361 TaxID=2594266 RepID=UPI00117BA9CE|nr:hypothetical protein [Fulvivirga sp. M361]TRX49683.1 hypothetical protein FNH22_26810 [Fulvivirga sp. M361]